MSDNLVCVRNSLTDIMEADAGHVPRWVLNLYATLGHHKHAEEFNRVQRGHQSMFETMPNMITMALIGGLIYPLSTTACAVMYSLGNFLYLIGYSDMSLNVRTARYMRGGGLKQVGLWGVFVTCCGAIWSLLEQA